MGQEPQKIVFEIHTPADADQGAGVRRNIASAIARGLPLIEPRPKRLSIVANGPSARAYLAQAHQHDTLAVNGALKLFTDEGGYPTYWMACDPQARVVEFLADPPLQTVYLVASKCDPSVFDALRGRDVRLWHVADQPLPPDTPALQVCTSVTLSALQMAARLGYRLVDVYGWDGAYKEGRHHSGADIGGPEGEVVQLNVGGDWNGEDCVGGRWFSTSATWALEAQEATTIVPWFEWLGMEITVHGDTLFSAIRTLRGEEATARQPQT